MAQQGTIRQIVRGFDRIDAFLDKMPDEDAKVILVRVNKLIKKFGIPANKTSTEKVRASSPPSTKQVATRKHSDKTPNRKPTQESKGMAKELSPAEIKAYAEEHGLKFKKGADKAAVIAEHQKHFKVLVKKGSDKLVALGEKNIDGFKVDGRIRKEEARAAKAADMILAAGYVPAGKGIAAADGDEKASKKTSAKASTKTSAKAEKATSKKETVKAKKTRRSRDEDEDDEDEDDTPKKKRTSKKTVEKPAKGKKVVEKTTKKKVRRDDDEDETPKKKAKKSSKVEKVVKTKKKAKKSRD